MTFPASRVNFLLIVEYSVILLDGFLSLSYS